MSEEIKQDEGKEKVAKVVKSKSHHSPLPSFTVWLIVMMVYLMVFAYTGYIAFWPMAFNDPDNTVKKYIEMVEVYEAKLPSDADYDFKPVMEELMKKSDSSASSMQQLASQSFNIVLGAFLAFLSATVTMIFQSRRPDGDGDKDKEDK
jgi:hypothetical protein